MEELPSEFVVEGWHLGRPEHADLPDATRLELHYRRGDDHFVEAVTFPVTIEPTAAVERLLDLLNVAAGVSYVKACVPACVTRPTLALTEAGEEAVRALYDDGLREFAVTSGFGLPVPVELADGARIASIPPPDTAPGRPLVPIGAGRDSSVVTLALAHLDPVLVSVGRNRFAERIAGQLGLELLTVERQISPRLLALNAAGAPNGHVPVTAINSLISVVLAEHLGGLPVVMANERGASAPTRHVVVGGERVPVNHQFSKAARFEQLLRAAIVSTGSAVRYGSVLRHAAEQRIARAFALRGEALHGAFMSCNRAMIRDPERRSDGWCADCPKCRSVYLSLAPFMSPAALTAIFGIDLLADANQIDGFVDLVQPDTKPFECVAEVDEARRAASDLIVSPHWSAHPGVAALADALARHGFAAAGSLVDVDTIDTDDTFAEREPGQLPDPLFELVDRFLDA